MTPSDETQDAPLYTPTQIEAACVGTVCVLAFLLAMALGLWLLWTHDATLRATATDLLAMLQQALWAHLNASW